MVPGSLCAMPLQKFKLSAEKGVDDSMSNVLALYFRAHLTQRQCRSVQLHGDQSSRKGESKLANDVDACSSGIFVNTSGFIDGEGFDILKHCIEALN